MHDFVQQPSVFCITDNSCSLLPSCKRISAEKSTKDSNELCALDTKVVSSEDMSSTQCDKISNACST